MTTAVSRPGLHPPRRPDEETDEGRIYNGVAFATDDYVAWIIGKLRLGRADPSRMRSSGVPVLRSHQPNNVVGAVTRVEKADGVWRSNWRLPVISANADTFDQMDTGILRGVSVGGNLDWNSLKIDNEDDASWADPDSILWSADWALVEQSLTAIPADTRAGVDRAAVAVLERDAAIFDTIVSSAGITTRQGPDTLARLESLVRTHNENLSLRREEREMTTKTEIPDIPSEVIERAIAEQLRRSESLQALAQLPNEIAKLTQALDDEAQRNMTYRAKLDRLEFQPGGKVLQLDTWTPGVNRTLDFGKILRLTLTDDIGLPVLDKSGDTSLEESVIERAELGTPGRNVAGRIPWAALAAYEEQLQLQRITTANAAGARPLEIDILGNGGLLLSSFAPILGRMMVKFGVTGGQKAPWATTQMTAAAAAEGADIPVTNLVVNNAEHLPVSVASAYEFTSSLRAVDDGTVEAIARMAIFDILQDQVTSQILVGGGTDEILGLWGTADVPNVDYGAAQADFTRDDVIDWFDHVRLSKADGGMYTCVMGDSLWKLCEKTPRGVDGTSSAGYTDISAYLLEMMGMHMGMMEGVEAFHYADFAPTGATDAGLMFKADRCVVWFWGDSLSLEWVPQLARKDVYKMCAEVNMEAFRPAQNIARIKQT